MFNLSSKKYEVTEDIPDRLDVGEIVQHFGSDKNNGIDAFLIEVHGRISLDAAKREQFTEDFSESLVAFMGRFPARQN